MSSSLRARGAALRLALGAALLGATGCGYAIPAAVGAFLAGQQGGSGKSVVIVDKEANLLVSRGPADPGDSPEGKGQSVVALQVRLSATKTTTLRTLRFRASGSGDDRTLTKVRLIHDQDGDGRVGAQEPQVGTSTLFGEDDGQVAFTGLELQVPGGSSVDLLLVFDTPLDAPEQAEFRVSVAQAADVSGETLPEEGRKAVEVVGLPLTSGSKKISAVGSLTLSTGASSPGPQTSFPNAVGVVVQQLELRTSSVEPVEVDRVFLRNVGSGVPLTHIARADLYEDKNGDGKLDKDDPPIRLNAAPSAQSANGVLIDGFNQLLPSNAIARWLVVYSFTGAAADGATFRVQLEDQDVGARGATSHQTIQPKGTPLQGSSTVTILRATVAVTLGPLNGGTQATPGATGRNVLQLQLKVGPAEPVVLTSLTIASSGTGNERTELSSARLFIDGNGDGSLAGEQQLGGTALFNADDGSVTFSNFQRLIGLNSSEQWLVVFDVGGAAGAGVDFQARVDGPASLKVSGQTSTLPITADFPQGSPLLGGKLSVTGSLQLAPGPSMPPGSTPLANDANLLTLQLRLIGGVGEAMRPTGIAVRPSGSADDAADVLGVDLILDADSSGTFNAGDSVLASSVFPGNDAPVSFSNAAGLIPGDIPAGATRDLLVRYRLSGGAFQDETFSARVDPSDLIVVGVSSGLVVPAGGSAAVGNVHAVRRARLNVSAGPANPGDGDALAGQPNLGVLQVRVDTGPGEDVQVTSVTARAAGTAVDPADVQSVTLWRDVGTTPGVVDAGDVMIGTAQAYGADDGFVTFTGAPLYVQGAGTNQSLLVAYTMAPTAVTPRTSVSRWAGPADIAGVGVSSGLSSQTLGPTVTGGLKTIRRGSLTVRAGSSMPPAASVFPNAKGLAVLQVELQAGFPESVQIDSVKVSADGTANEAAAVTSLSLVLDQNGDGFPASGEPILAGPAVIADDGAVTFNLAAGVLTVPAAQTRQLLVVYDLSGTVVPPGNLHLKLTSTADVAAQGLTSLQPIPPGGTAPSGNLFTLKLGSLALSTTAQNPGAGNALRNQPNVPLLQVRLDTGAVESVRLSSLKVTHQGTGPAAGVQTLRLYQDVNANGLLDSDALLATTTYAGGVATFSPAGGFDVPSASTAHLLVVADFAATPAAGETFQVALAANADLTVTGNSSALPIPVSGAPLTGGLKTAVLASLAVAAGGQTPAARDVLRNEKDVELLQVKLTAGSAEPVEVTNLRFTATGAGNPQTQISRVRLYLENDPPDGKLNGDVLLGDFPNYGAGGVLNVAPVVSLSIPAAGSKSVLLVVDHAAPAGSAGTTFGAQLAAASTDVTARGVISRDAVTATGVPPALSNQHTVREASLALAQGSAAPGDKNVALVQTDVEVQQLRLTAGPAEVVRVTGLTFTFAGTATAQTAVTSARLYLDQNVNGKLDADPLLGTATFGAGGTVSFSPVAGALDVPAGGSSQVLLVYDVGGTTADAQTLSARLASATDVTASGLSSGLAVSVSGAPPAIAGATLTAVERTLSIQQALVIPNKVVFSNETNLAALSVKLTAGISEGVRLNALTFRGDPVGTGNDAGISVRLFRDLDEDGVLDASDAPIGTAQTYAGDPGAVTFGTALDIAAGTTITFLVVYDLPGTASAGQTFRPRFASTADVTAVGLVSGSPVTYVGGPFPIGGATFTVQSSTLTLSAATQVPAGTIFRNQSGVPMVRWRAAAGALEDVKVTNVTIRPDGATTGNPTQAQVRLFLDANANGTLDVGTDTQLGTTQAGSAASVSFTDATGLVTVARGGTRDFLVVWDYDGSPVAGQAFAARLNVGDVAGVGSATGAAVPVSGGPFVGGTKTVVEPSLSASLGPADPGARNVLQKSTNLAVLQVRLSAGPAEAVRVSQLRLSASGGGNDQTDLTRVELYRDDNANGLLDGDTSLGSATAYPADDGTLVFAIAAGQVDVPAGGSLHLLLVYDLAAGATPGKTFRAALANPAADVTAAGLTSTLAVTTGGGAVTGGLQSVVDTTLGVATGPANPGASNELINAQAVEVLQVRLTAGTSEGVRITQLVVRGSGSGGEVADLTDVELYHDVDGDGKVTGADTLLRSGVAYAADDGAVTFNGLTFDIAGGTSRDLLVAYDFGGAAAAGKTYQARLQTPSVDITARGVVSSVAPTITGATVTGGVKTLVPTTLALAAGPNNPGAGTAFTNQTLVPTLQLRLSAGTSEGVRVTQVVVKGSGTGSETADLVDVALYLDVDSNGQVTGADTLLRNGVAYAADDGSVTFNTLALDIPAGTTRDVVVAYSFGGGAAAGKTYQAALQTPSADVTAQGLVSGLAAAVSGPTVTGGQRSLVAASLSFALGPANPAAGNVVAGATDVEVLQVRFSAGAAESVRVEQVRLTPSGTADDPTELALVALYRDANGNGQLDGDPLLASGTFAANDAAQSFTVNLDVPASGTADLLVVVNVAAGATVGRTFAASIVANGDVTARGLVSTLTVAATGAPASGQTQTIVAAAAVTASLSAALGPQDVYAGQQHALLALRLQETSGQDAVRLTQLNVQAAGTGGDDTDVTLVRLYRDVAPLGVLDAGDVAIGVSAFFVNDGVAAFAGLSEVVAAGGTRDFLVSYTFASSASATPGETFQPSVPAGGLVLVQVGSGLSVVPTGLPQTGALGTVRGPTLTASAGPQSPAASSAAEGEARALLQVRLDASPAGAVTVTALQLQASGSGNDQTGVARAELYADLDEDGAVGPGDRLLGALSAPFGADDGLATFSGLSETVSASGRATWLVRYVLATSGLSAPQTFTASLSGLTAGSATVTGLPLAGAAVTVQGALVVSLSQAAPIRSSLSLPGAEQAVALLDLRASAEAMTVTSLKVTPRGSAADGTDVSAVRLYRDDGDGVFEPGADDGAPLVAGVFPGDDLGVALALAEAIPQGTTRSLWVSVDLAASGAGKTFRVSVAAAADVSASGGTTGSGLVLGPCVSGPSFGLGHPGALFGAPTAVALAAAGTSVVDLLCADLDGDGDLDLAVLRSDGRVEVLLGDGSGAGYASKGSFAGGITLPGGPRDLLCGDLNRDGYPDLVLVYDDTVTVLLNQGAGDPANFPAAADYTEAGAQLREGALVDFDRDGDLDVVVLERTGPLLRGRRNDGAGDLTNTVGLSLLAAPLRLAALDADGDGKRDLALSDDGGAVRLLRGDGSFFALADADAAGAAAALVALDLDRDGYEDVVAVDAAAGLLRPLLSDAPASATLTPAATSSSAPAPVTTQTTPAELAVADLDGDGLLDLVIPHAGADGLVARLGGAGLPFVDAGASSYEAGADPDQVALGDLDRDGDPDAVVGSSSAGAGQVHVLRGDGATKGGAAGFAPPTSASWTGPARGVAIADLDRDGRRDLVAVSQALGVWRQTKPQVFAPLADASLAAVASAVAVGDLDRDGIPDLAVALAGGSVDRVEVYRGNGDGTFAGPAGALLSGDTDPSQLVLFDKDGDGALDAVVAESRGSAVQLLRGTGSGLASALAGDRYATASPVHDVLVGDLNRDGRADVAAVCSGGTVEVRLGGAAFGLGAATSVTLSGSIGRPSAGALADLDRDGKLDLIVVGAGGVELLRGDGAGGFSSQGTLLGVTGLGDVAAADLDKDGDLDLVASGSNGLVVYTNTSAGFAFGAPQVQSLGGAAGIRLALGDLDGDGDADVVVGTARHELIRLLGR
ncbi:MAG: FG-GAP-like repeat-containing protein [Planctomycetota bacterium]